MKVVQIDAGGIRSPSPFSYDDYTLLSSIIQRFFLRFGLLLRLRPCDASAKILEVRVSQHLEPADTSRNSCISLRYVLGEKVSMYPKPRTATRYGLNDGCEFDRAPVAFCAFFLLKFSDFLQLPLARKLASWSLAA